MTIAKMVKVKMMTEKGYIKVWDSDEGRMEYEHILVWKRENGPLPKGMQIHHKNGKKADNRPLNLVALTPMEHRRIHSGYEMRNGEWYKRCRGCGEFKPVVPEHWFVEDGAFKRKLCKICRKEQIKARERRLRIVKEA